MIVLTKHEWKGDVDGVDIYASRQVENLPKPLTLDGFQEACRVNAVMRRPLKIIVLSPRDYDVFKMDVFDNWKATP